MEKFSMDKIKAFDYSKWPVTAYGHARKPESAGAQWTSWISAGGQHDAVICHARTKENVLALRKHLLGASGKAVKPGDEIPFIIRIPDNDDPQYDQFVKAPPDMQKMMAIEKLDKAIAKVKKANPDDYTFDDLMAEIEPLGFSIVSYDKSTQTW